LKLLKENDIDEGAEDEKEILDDDGT